jgi:hypothetical protein
MSINKFIVNDCQSGVHTNCPLSPQRSGQPPTKIWCLGAHSSSAVPISRECGQFGYIWLKNVVVLLTHRAAASHKPGPSCTYCVCGLPGSHRTQLAKACRGRSRRSCARKRRSFNFAFSSTRTFPTTRAAPSSPSKSKAWSRSSFTATNKGLAQAYQNCLDQKTYKDIPRAVPEGLRISVQYQPLTNNRTCDL